MASPVQKSLYGQVVEVVYEYLGPAAQRFVDREIQSHIGKSPEDLNNGDIDKLHDWCKIAIAMMADDDDTVERFSESMLALKDDGD